MAANQTAKIRAQIAEVKREIREVQAARPPLKDQVDRVRNHLESLAKEARERLVDRAADVINHGVSTMDMTPPPAVAPFHGFGLALDAAGIEAIIAEAQELAAQQDTGALRLDSSAKRERLVDLARRLYELELADEAALAGEERRPDANGAAVLGIPLNAAEEFDLLGVEGA